MKVRFVALGNPLDARYWSGIPHAMHDALVQCGCDVRVTADLGAMVRYRFAPQKAFWRLRGREFLWSRTQAASRVFARAIEAGIRPDDELVFSPESMPVSLLETKKPIVIWTDAVFDQMADYYPGRYFSQLPECSRADARRQEHAAVTRAALCVFSSRWAADAAAREHGVPAARLAVIPFGANIVAPARAAVEAAVARRVGAGPRFLFVGVEWDRKGGPKALEVVRLLREAGCEAELAVIGAAGLERAGLPPWVTHHGFVDKNTEAGRSLVAAEFARACFMILPTLADATPIVFAEASAWGVPSLGTETGGVPEMVTAGNGLLFATSAPPATYVQRLLPLLADRKTYRRLALSSRDTYERRFDWTRNVGRLLDLVRERTEGNESLRPFAHSGHPAGWSDKAGLVTPASSSDDVRLSARGIG